MEVTVYQRKDGGIETAVRIISRAIEDKLLTEVYSSGKQVCCFETVR